MTASLELLTLCRVIGSSVRLELGRNIVNIRTFVFGLLLALIAASTPRQAQASIITAPSSGAFTGALQLTPDLLTVLASDFRANGTVDVFDDSVPVLLSTLFGAALGAPFPNAVWGIGNLGPTEYGLLTFDTSSISLFAGGFTVLADFVPATALTDPGLLALVGQHLATFQFAQAIQFSDSVVAIYSLDHLASTSQVPEPASALLFGSGMLLAVVYRRTRRGL